MTPLERMRKEVEILRVEAAKKEMEFKIMERLDEIERIKGHIKIQEDRAEELKKELSLT